MTGQERVLTRDWCTATSGHASSCTPFFLLLPTRRWAGRQAHDSGVHGLAAPFVSGEAGVFRGLISRGCLADCNRGGGKCLVAVIDSPYPFRCYGLWERGGGDVGGDGAATGEKRGGRRTGMRLPCNTGCRSFVSSDVRVSRRNGNEMDTSPVGLDGKGEYHKGSPPGQPRAITYKNVGASDSGGS